jgi:hypothetical protein
MQEKLWLYEDPLCEQSFMESFKSDPWMLFSLTYKMFIDSSLDSDFIWLLFNYKFEDNKFVIKDYKGNSIDKDKSNIEVDIIGGKCKSHICYKDKSFKIRPLLDFIIAIEVKCSRYDYENDKLNAKQRKQKKIQRQLHDRLQMGFDKVSLLDILFTNPGTGNGIWAWLNASDKINNVHDFMQKDNILKNRLNNRSLDSVGHYFFGKGSVKKDDTNEFLNGSGEVNIIKGSKLNPFLKNEIVMDNRKKMEEKFISIDIAKNYPFNKLNDEKIMALRMQVSPINLKDGAILYLFLNQL